MSNGDLYDVAVKAINDLFSDTSVSKETAIENLKSLRGEIGTLIDSLEVD
jgi:hypothetical protein